MVNSQNGRGPERYTGLRFQVLVGWLAEYCPIAHRTTRVSGGGKESGIILTYIYRHVYKVCRFQEEYIGKDQLLVPPMMLSHRLWKDGYMTPLGEVNDPGEGLLKRHCFWHMSLQQFHDENGKVLNKMTRPCGASGVFLYDGLCKWLAKSLRDGFDQYNHPVF